jgi:regulator of protease activity HflC (stomatin/prohibitin superfamily)
MNYTSPHKFSTNPFGSNYQSVLDSIESFVENEDEVLEIGENRQKKEETEMETQKVYAEPRRGHISLGTPLRMVLFLIPVIAMGLVLFTTLGKGTESQRIAAVVIEVVIAVIWGIIISGIRLAAQWERAVVLRLGRFRSVKGPGMIYITPFIDHARFIDLRLLTLNIPSQQVITKDNVPAAIDGVLFFLVADAEKAVIHIQDFAFAIAQYAQATLRDVVGGLSLDELLSEREQIQNRIAEIVEEHIRNWGLHLDSIRLQDIEMPEDLKRIMSRQASAEREKRATITKAEGDKIAAVNLAAAADIMEKTPGAMKLRTLQTVDGLGAGPANTVIMFPVELTEAIKSIVQSVSRKGSEETP